jgi:hypothetical protein
MAQKEKKMINSSLKLKTSTKSSQIRESKDKPQNERKTVYI